MSADSRIPMLNAVLLGVLLVGSSLPFDVGQGASMWNGTTVGAAAGARVAVLVLVVVLVSAVIGGASLWIGALQLESWMVVVLTTRHAATSTEPEAGSGATLVVLTALVSAAVGLCAIGADLAQRRRARDAASLG